MSPDEVDQGNSYVNFQLDSDCLDTVLHMYNVTSLGLDAYLPLLHGRAVGSFSH